MKQVTLQSLSCQSTEDLVGADECRLEIYADGELEHSFRAELNDGSDWPLKTTVLFGTEVAVRLFDEDGPMPGDDDDELGVVSIPAAETADAVGVFDRDGADYRLSYTVVDRADLGATDLVEAELRAFEASSVQGAWSQIDKAGLIADMRATIADPVSEVYQGSSAFCGPTAIVFELVSRMPRRYVRLCRSLYETGSFEARTATVTASEGLRDAPVGQGMSVADWMLVATMRESENAVFGVDPNAGATLGGVQGLTTPWEMQGWTSEILGKQNTAISTTYVWGEIDAIRYAEQVYAAGGVAFLLIHDVLLDKSDDSTVPPWPTHWVAYRGGLTESEGGVGFWVYSWGSVEPVSKTANRFESCLFGIVTGF
jgi:hypothetical protein